MLGIKYFQTFRNCDLIKKDMRMGIENEYPDWEYTIQQYYTRTRLISVLKLHELL